MVLFLAGGINTNRKCVWVSDLGKLTPQRDHFLYVQKMANSYSSASADNNIYSLCHLCGGRRNTLATVCVWRSEDNLKEWILLFFVGSGNQTQVIRFRGKLLYTLILLLDLLEARDGAITGVIFQLLMHVGASLKMSVPRPTFLSDSGMQQITPRFFCSVESTDVGGLSWQTTMGQAWSHHRGAWGKTRPNGRNLTSSETPPAKMNVW